MYSYMTVFYTLAVKRANYVERGNLLEQATGTKASTTVSESEQEELSSILGQCSSRLSFITHVCLPRLICTALLNTPSFSRPSRPLSVIIGSFLAHHTFYPSNTRQHFIHSFICASSHFPIISLSLTSLAHTSSHSSHPNLCSLASTLGLSSFVLPDKLCKTTRKLLSWRGRTGSDDREVSTQAGIVVC